MCVCVCVCVREGARAGEIMRETEWQIDNESDRDREREIMRD